MEILTNPAINIDNKNIRVYWNIDQNAVAFIVTNSEDNKRLDEGATLVYSSNINNDVDRLNGMFKREILGRLTTFYNIPIGIDHAEKLANALLNYADAYNVLGRKITANQVLEDIGNKEFAQIFHEVQKEVMGNDMEDGHIDNATEQKESDEPPKNKSVKRDINPINGFKDYLKQFHSNELYNINKRANLPQTIVIDWGNLNRFDDYLGNTVVNNPQNAFGLLNRAFIDLITNKDNLDIDNDIIIKFDHLEHTPTNMLLANKVGQMIQTEGIIKGVLEPTFYYKKAVFECKKCMTLHEVEQTDIGRLIEPSMCNACQSRDFRLLKNLSIAEDLKYIRLQEPTDDLSTDERPRNILCCLTGGNTRGIVNGAKIRIIGVLNGQNEEDGTNKFVIDANNVVHLEDKQIEISDEDERAIIGLSKNHDIIDILINSIAPHLHIPKQIKLAVLCYLVKAGYTNTERQDIHILIIGDPGTGKTQLKECAFKLTEKGIKASGTNASGVGLTGAVDKDPVLNVPMVNPGAIPMANNGHLFLDESEKMPREESQKMLDGMESGEFTISKWGLNETLPAKTSIFAIGNPIYGRFDPYSNKSINDQLNIYPPLLSRYDLVIALEDKPNVEMDTKIGKSILNQFKPNDYATEEDGIMRLSFDMLRKYLAYCRRNFNPVPINDDELEQQLIDYYNEARAMGKDARSFLAVNRFAGAIAKLKQHDHIHIDDYNLAIDMQNYSLKTLGMDPLDGKIDIDNVRGNLNNKDKRNRDAIKKVMTQYINSDDNLDVDSIPKQTLIEECQRQFDMGKSTFYKAFKQLKNAKEIYETHKQVYFKY